MGVIAKGIPRGCQGLFTPVSLGYPLSVFNKNSTLKAYTAQDHVTPRELQTLSTAQEMLTRLIPLLPPSHLLLYQPPITQDVYS